MTISSNGEIALMYGSVNQLVERGRQVRLLALALLFVPRAIGVREKQ